ncbi:ribulose-phosphate 3-epimerase [Patescibacteria group bacterium]|nr:ribulose-phosphate 3-epimerase [Patescibacteria group bacterium]
MSKKIKIIPSILSKNKAEFTKHFKKISPYFNYVQIDIMDGQFVKEKNSITPDVVQYLTKKHNLEIHLMVDGVSKYVTRWVKLKNVKKIIWHYEANTDHDRILAINKFLKAKKIKTGLAINPNTPLYKIKDLIKYFDTIQVMGVTPGKQGQRFQPKSLKKIKALRSKYPKLNIEVDGAVNEQTFPAIKYAGANIVCPGSYFQKSKNIKESLKKIA